MKVFIAGATGVLGRRLVRRFRERGHAVVGLVRSDYGEDIVRSLGGETRRADLFDPDDLARAAEGAEIVVHAATSIPTGRRPSAVDWEMNDRIRREGTRALASCAGKVSARLYIQQSVVWVARPPDGAAFDEEDPPRPDRITLSAVDGEIIAREEGERSGFAVGVLRFGWFYGADAAHTRLIGEGVARRKMPLIGKVDRVLSCIHLDDAAEALVAAAEGGRSGVWHVVDDRPVKVAEFFGALAERLGAKPPRRVPVWLARLLAGPQAVAFFTSSTRTSNRRFRQEFGWAPCFPHIGTGLDEVVSSWKAEGFPP